MTLQTNKSKQGPYKQTGNIAVDMVASCINHYERQGRRVAYIRLDFIHWSMFKGYVLEQIPAYDLSNGEIEFDDVIITQGSSLQVKPLYHELVADGKPKHYIMN